MIINPFVFSAPAASGARYWRMVFETVGVNLKEAELFASSDGSGVDQAYGSGGTAFASSVYPGGYNADLAFNGDKTGTAAPDVWSGSTSDVAPKLGYIFPAAVSVNSIKITARVAYTTAQAPKAFIVQSSTDSTTGLDGTWTNEWNSGVIATWTTGQTKTFPRASFTHDVYDTKYIGPQTSVTNAFQTMVRTGSGYVNTQGLRTYRSHTSGKYYAEFTVLCDPNQYTTNVGLGSGETSSLGSVPVHQYVVRISYGGGGGAANVVDTTVYTSSPPTNKASGSIVGIAVDFDAGKVWYSINGAYFVGTNLAATADPATGTNPSGTFTPGTELWLVAMSPFQGTEATLNTGQSAYVYGPPSGFGNW